MKYTLLEPLRGVAALWVFAFHFSFSEQWRSMFPSLTAIVAVGDLGVPMFFVISGFCIAAAADGAVRRGMPVHMFLQRRLRRIYPPFWCSILVCAAVPFVSELLASAKTGTYTPPSSEVLNFGYLDYGVTDWLSVGTLLQVFRSVPGANSLQFKFTTINAVYWTLAIEVQFYLAVALAVATGRRLFTSLAALTAMSLVATRVPGLSLTGVFLPFWPMFAIGVAVYLLFRLGYRPSAVLGSAALPVSAVAAVCGPVALVAWVLAGWPLDGIGFAAAFGVWVFAVEALDRPFEERLKAGVLRPVLRLVVLFGAMSYSVYLVHGRLQLLGAQAARQIVQAGTVPHDVLAYVATLAGCYAFYLAAERPFLARERSSTPVS